MCSKQDRCEHPAHSPGVFVSFLLPSGGAVLVFWGFGTSGPRGSGSHVRAKVSGVLRGESRSVSSWAPAWVCRVDQRVCFSVTVSQGLLCPGCRDLLGHEHSGCSPSPRAHLLVQPNVCLQTRRMAQGPLSLGDKDVLLAEVASA